MNSPIHILNQLGVLSSFSVAKKVTEEDINKYFAKHKRTGKSDTQIGEMLKNKILSEINEAVKSNKIPGILSPQELAESMGMDQKIISNMPDLNKLVMVLANKLVEKNYDKMSLCYFINSLVNVLSLTEDDFTKFHRQNNTDEDEGGNDDDYEEGDDGDFEDQ